MKKILITLITLNFVVLPSFSKSNLIELTLKDCIDLSLKNNLDLEIQKISPKLQNLSLKKVSDNFGVTFGLKPNFNQSISPSSSSFISGGSILKRFRQNYDLYLRKDFSFGGNLSLDLKNSVLNSNSTRADFNPAVTPRLSASFSQPLLKGFNNGTKLINIEENKTVSEKLRLKSKTIDTVFNTQNLYWSLVSAYENLKVLKNSLKLTRDLLEINKEKEKAGFLAKIDVLTTEANLAGREERLLLVQKNMIRNENDLKRMINSKKISFSDKIVTIDRAKFIDRTFTIESSFKIALENRPDFKINFIELKNLELNKKLLEQNSLPKLNMISNIGLESLDKNYFTAFGKLFNFQTYFWSLGLSLEVPAIGNINETRLSEVKLIIEQKQKIIENIKQKMYTNISNSVLSIKINKKRIEANKLAKMLSEQQIKAETEKFNLGLSTNFQVLQFQKDFEQASLNEVNATIDYIKSINQLLALEGSLLKENGIIWYEN